MTHILFFGDSITYGVGDRSGGFVERIRAEINKSGDTHRVYNLGVSGDTSAGVRKRLRTEAIAGRLADDEQNVIVVAIGTNDSATMKDKQSQWVAPAEFAKNMHTIIADAKKLAVVILINILPVDESRVRPVPWLQNLEYTNEQVDVYNRILSEIAKQTAVPLIDIHAAVAAQHFATLLVDGLHPNTSGYDLIARTVLAALQQHKLV